VKNLTCVVVGDINIDYVADVSDAVLHGDISTWVSTGITSSVGGNATFFAEAACEAGFSSVRVVCSLGDDAAGDIAMKYFATRKIDLDNVPSALETGKVLILYQPEDQRILIADRGSNATLFSSPAFLDLVKSSLPTDLLYVSGYSVLNDAGVVSLNDLVDVYKRQGACVVLDAVPHEIFQLYDWADYVSRCGGADGIVIELPTAQGFMNQVEPSIDSVSDFLLESFHFCLIRLNAASDFVFADRTRNRTFRIPYQPRTSSLRFTDRVLAQTIVRYLRDPDEIFTESLWIDDVAQTLGDEQ